MVYWNTTEVVMALIGGALIAISSTLNLNYYGKITGLSGMFYSVVTHDEKSGFYWKYSFLLGLITLPILAHLTVGDHIKLSDSLLIILFDPNFVALNFLSIPGWILGGLLVGFGTKLGNGCTSGHGVCGIPRFSIRSIIATCTFMAFGCAMATFRYNFPFFYGSDSFGK